MSELFLSTVAPLALLASAVIVSIFSLFMRKLSPLLLTMGVGTILVCIAAATVIFFRPDVFNSPMLGFALLLSSIGLMLGRPRRDEVLNPLQMVIARRAEDMGNRIKLYFIFNSLKDPVLVIKPDEMVVFMNQAAVDALGDHVGMNCNFALQCSPEDCRLCAVRTSEGKEGPHEYREISLEGRRYQATVNRIHNDPEGTLLFILHDVTEEKILERQLLINEKMMSLGQLIAGVTHELNNPMTFLNANLETFSLLLPILEDYLKRLESGFESSAQGGDAAALWREVCLHAEEEKLKAKFEDFSPMLVDMNEGMNRVREIIRDLQNFSHQGSNVPEAVNLNELIELTLRVAVGELKNRVRVEMNLADGMPQIGCLPQQLKQVFLNLFVNAAQAMEGEKEGLLSISSDFQQGHFQVVVADNGPGIARVKLKRIFDPFYTTKGVGKGTGLGLAVVYGIIERHRGEISVDSDLGEGTRFTIKLPEKMRVDEPEKAKPVSIYSS